MYFYIKGELVETAEDLIVVENHGIGYNIRIPQSIFDSLPRFRALGSRSKFMFRPICARTRCCCTASSTATTARSFSCF